MRALRRLHLIDGPNPGSHVTYDDDPDAIPDCPCEPLVRVDIEHDLVLIEHRPL